MSTSLGSADFFALEAGECLDRLETVITRSEGLEASELLRHARALRGSALMASQTPIARAAAGFEAIARAVRDKGRAFDAATRERCAHAVDELRHLVRRSTEWSEADTQRAGRLAAELDALAGGPLPDPRSTAHPGGGSTTGVRAFVARESALIASALDRAARALAEAPEAREPLYAVLRRMQSLRGLAELGELSPLPEILDAVELAVGDLTRLFAPPPRVPELLDSAAAALTRIARDVAEHGRPETDPPEALHFTQLLLQAFGSEADVVPVESLLAAGQDAVSQSDAQPQFAAPEPLSAIELVSHGEHFVQSAIHIRSVDSAAARDLRLYAMVPSLRAAATAGGDPVTPALARFARAARNAIADGTARRQSANFTDHLNECGTLLREIAESGLSEELGQRLHALATAFGAEDEPEATPRADAGEPSRATGREEEPAESAGGMRTSRAAPTAAGEAEGEADVLAIAALAYDDESVYASPDPAREAVDASSSGERDDEPVDIMSLAPSDRLPLETGFDRYAALRAGGSVQQAEESVMNIEALLYRGASALRRVAELRTAIRNAIGHERPLREVEPMMDELLDLVPLAMER